MNSEPKTWICRYVPLDYEPEQGEHVTRIPIYPHCEYSQIAVKEVREEDE